jgi:hypothetical protein
LPILGLSGAPLRGLIIGLRPVRPDGRAGKPLGIEKIGCSNRRECGSLRGSGPPFEGSRPSVVGSICCARTERGTPPCVPALSHAPPARSP